MKKLLLLFVLAILTAVFLCLKVDKIISTPQKVDGEIVFQINKGDSMPKIAEELANNGLVNNAKYFLWYAKFHKIYPKIKAGEYMIDHDVNFADVAEVLQSGKFYWRKVTIPEGLTAAQIKDILLNNEFLQGDIPEFGEGEILPETYTFMKGETRENIIKQAKKALNDTLGEIWAGRAENLPLNSPYELLILASIVEKETGLPDERADVASVFVNRLRIGMRLQTDPTVIYAITKGKTELGRPLYKKDLSVESPYNTYLNTGLPPTPICAAGKEAIYAAAHPTDTEYLYFVSSGNGGHNFAKSLSDHNKNVQIWRKKN
ncbi:MAG: endolytic transglycosylase MltG [Alphaproteobacteria bacterium]|nr:endolytic transglycosylase MltG [Alphaproteobacteria bacterium]